MPWPGNSFCTASPIMYSAKAFAALGCGAPLMIVVGAAPSAAISRSPRVRVSDTLTRCERLVAAEGADNYAWEAARAGHKTQMVFPTDGAFVVPAPTAVIKGSPHAAAAKAFAEFLISDTVQKLFPGEGIYAARADIPPPAGSQPLGAIKIMPVDYDRIEKEAKSLKDRFNEIFQ